MEAQPRTGIVVIGRDEGERLRRCLRGVLELGVPVVYADSGSSDGSPGLARVLGVDCVELAAGLPFSAARGRNEGFARLLERHPGVEFVQFVDGDCELDTDWLATGVEALDLDPSVAVVFGRLCEIAPQASLYNRLCDMEWQHAPGPVDEALGVMLVRASVFEAVGGFAAHLSAGEEGDLCARLIRAGHAIHCLDAVMGRHDAAMLRFGQWWTRSSRNGYGCARTLLGACTGEDVQFQPWDVRCIASALVWALALPATALLLGVTLHAVWLLLAPAAWLLMYRRIRARTLQRGFPRRDASAYALFVLIGKVADLAGIARFVGDWLTGRRHGQAIRYRDRAAV